MYGTMYNKFWYIPIPNDFDLNLKIHFRFIMRIEEKKIKLILSIMMITEGYMTRFLVSCIMNNYSTCRDDKYYNDDYHYYRNDDI